jgi:teichuronic acid exporter
MIRAIATILRGSVLAQIVGFAILPLLSRSFAPEAFGYFQVFQSVLAFLLIAVTLRYEIAVLRAENEAELSAVLGLCAGLMVLTTTIVVGALLIARSIGWPTQLAALKVPLWLIAVSMFVGGGAQLLGYLATRVHGYRLVANSKVGQAVANAGLTAGLALTSPLPTGLILGDLLGRLVNLVWLARGTLETLRAATSVTFASMGAAARKFRDLSLISLPSTLISAAGTSLTPLLVYGNFDAATSGQFGLVERSIGLPIGMIVVAISQVHMAHLATDMRSGSDDARRNYRRIAGLLATIAIPAAALCVLFAQPLYRIVFGPGWDQAAHFAQLMAPAYVLALITGGVNMTLTIMGRQKTQFAWDASRFAAMAALWVTAPAAGWPVEWMIAAHSAIMSLFAVTLLAVSYRALPRGEAQLEAALPARLSDDAVVSEGDEGLEA